MSYLANDVGLSTLLWGNIGSLAPAMYENIFSVDLSGAGPWVPSPAHPTGCARQARPGHSSELCFWWAPLRDEVKPRSARKLTEMEMGALCHPHPHPGLGAREPTQIRCCSCRCCVGGNPALCLGPRYLVSSARVHDTVQDS